MRKNLSQLFDEFLYEAEFVKRVRPETLRGYRGAFFLFIKLMPEVSKETLTTQCIIEYFRKLHERQRMVGKGVLKIGIKKSTAATYWSKLNAFCSWLHHKKHIAANPFSQLSYPTPSYEDRKFLSKEDLEKIITAIHTHHYNNILLLKRNLAMFYLLLYCGLRREELMLLLIRDIDFERKVLIVRADTSKSGRTRELPLHSSALMYLKDYVVARKSYTTPLLIVSSKKDEALTLDGLRHLVDQLKEKSGVSFHLHQFRHTFALNFLKHSNNIASLKQLLGHRSIAMTMTYLRGLPTDELRADVERMNIDTFM